MQKQDLSKKVMYEGVKTLVETSAEHLHLNQLKLYTLYSVAFQYMLFHSTKNPGIYLIRIEDSHLADKLVRKAKDDISRKFLDKLILPRRLKYGQSTFVLDYFLPGSWGQIMEMPTNKFKCALVVRNTTRKPFEEEEPEEGQEEQSKKTDAAEDLLYLHSVIAAFPKTITVAHGMNIPGMNVVRFPFIVEEEEILEGVKIADDIKFTD